MSRTSVLCWSLLLSVALIASPAEAAKRQTSTPTCTPTTPAPGTVPPVAPAPEAPAPPPTGGMQYGESKAKGSQDPTAAPTPATQCTVPGDTGAILPDGSAAAPANAPENIKQAIWAANTIQDKPYVYGGGHGDFTDDGYDCSGTVSFLLNAAGLLRKPRDSSGFMRYGKAGPGIWITVYTNPGHAYAVIAGLRLDTSAAGERGRRGRLARNARGPRWRLTGRPAAGFTVRHPLGF